MLVNVIGLGYIGLPTALMMSSHGVQIVGTDYNPKLVEKLNKGKTTFKERGIESLFARAVKCGIKFTTEYQKADMYILAVPTPYNEDTKKIDYTYVAAATKSVLEVCDDDAIIVIESTVSPGTIEKFIRPIVNKAEKTVHLAHAPERIIPGNMIYELLHNNRTIGADSREIGERVKWFYESFCDGEITLTDISTAEMTKVVENTFRAVNIAFANELAKICRHLEMDVYEIINICNKHPRVNILNPGPGVGGHCISVDPWFLVGDFPRFTKVIHEALDVNHSMPKYVLNRIYEIMKERELTDVSRVGLYGLTYKENVDDCRDSPTLQLLERQKRHLAISLKTYDPFVTEDIVEYQYHDFDQFLADIDFIVIMVKHQEICDNIDKICGKVVLDCVNVCELPETYHL